MRIVHTETCPDIGPICNVRQEPPQIHDQRLTVAELRASIDRAVNDVFAVEFQLPVRMVVSSIEFQRLDGTPFEPDYESIHHRSETLVGLGDPWAVARASLHLGSVVAMARVGATIPLGSTVPDPFKLGDNGLSHQHVQFGTGIFQPIVGVAVAHVTGGWRLRGHALAILGLYENRYGYRPGHRVLGGLGADAAVGDTLLSFGADVAREQEEHWAGTAHMEGNLGRTDVLLNMGVARPLSERWRWSLLVRVPVAQFVPHDAITYPGIVELRLDGTTAGK